MRRRAILIILCLLFGAIANVATAWWSALYAGGLAYYQIGFDTKNPPRTSTEDLNWIYNSATQIRMSRVTFGEFHALGLTRRGFWELPEWWDEGPPPENQWRPGKQNQVWDGIAKRNFLPFLPLAVRTSAGWPMRSFTAEQWLDRDHHDAFEYIYPLMEVYTYRGGRPMMMPYRPGGPLYHFPRVVPLTPIWLGFAVNTVVWAVIAAVVMMLPMLAWRGLMNTVFRRWLRRRRGQCPACGYPMGTSDICTECGRRLPKRIQPQMNADKHG